MKRRHSVVENVVRVCVVAALLALLTILKRALPCRTRMAARPFDRARDVLGDRRGELHEFASRTFERKAMLVISAHGIRLTPGCFGRLLLPSFAPTRRAANRTSPEAATSR